MDVPTSGFLDDYDPLYDGAIIDSTGRQPSDFSIIAFPYDSQNNSIGSVRYDWDGIENFRTENSFPYAIAGLNQNDNSLLPSNFTLGTHTLSATPFSQANATGTAGRTITFEITFFARLLSFPSDDISLTSFVDQAAPITEFLTISNTGNQQSSFAITNIPDWLTVEPADGVVLPGQDLTVALTTSACSEVGGKKVILNIAENDIDPSPVIVRQKCGSSQSGFDYELSRFYFNQAVPALDSSQKENERIGVIAGRPGIARAFVTANSGAAPLPEVRLFWRDENGASGSYELTGPSASLTTYDELQEDESFNVTLPAEFFVPGRSFYVAIDPDNNVPEIFEFNNNFPEESDGDYQPLNAAVLAVHQVTFIPMALNNGVTQISPEQGEDLYLDTRKLAPIADYDIQVRAQPYTYNNNAPGAGWFDLLNKLEQLRMLDNSDRYYHAVSDVAITPGGILGLANLEAKAAVSVRQARVIAHEFGHNLSLPHAPCGLPVINPQRPLLGTNPNYPYEGGTVNIHGYDIVTGQIYAPALTDFMGYCNFTWVSDWSFNKMMDYRGVLADNLNLKTTVNHPVRMQKSLLVSGYVDNGIFNFKSIRQADIKSHSADVGRYHLIGVDVFGGEIFRQAFNLNKIDHVSQLSFAIAVPFSASTSTIALLKIVDPATGIIVAQKENNYNPVVAKAQSQFVTSAVRTSLGEVLVSWNTALYESAIVRDLDTGNILTIDESGEIKVFSDANELEVTLTGGFIQNTEIVEVK
jgi:hypothetical protein